VTKDTLIVAGLVSSNLYAATLSGDADRLSVAEKGHLVGHLSRVFAWQIDFYRDVRPRDAFRLALERDLRPDGSVRDSRVLAAEYLRSDSLLTAVRFRPAGQARAFYFDENGTALRGAFLKAPLNLIRVTSRFGGSRFHPMLGGFRTHRGVDYGAAAGTPVRATGEGTVERAGWWGEYGLVIELQHGNGIRTRYAHLSSVERGVSPGAEITQGQTIGRVGSTGRSTAPHLHYEFLLRSIPTDPARVDLPVERPMREVDRESFARARAASWLQLSRVSWPGGPLARGVGGRIGTGGHVGP
jgi:murein DD-endopeptidase MepM/ murein hydrolase activator NlpD